MNDQLLTRVESQVGYITFNRPKVLNSFTPDFLANVIETIQRFENDERVRVIVFTGAGDAFSSGGDKEFLNDLTRMTPLEIRSTVYSRFGATAKAINDCSKPTIAAVNGPAVGAGCEMAVACDFRIVAKKAFFCESWIDLGVIPPLGGMFLLPRLIGLGRAKDMVMRGVRVYGEEAASIGLANLAVEREDLERAVVEFAQTLTSKAPLALSIAKDGLRRGLESSLGIESGFSVFAQSVLLNGPDFEEAVRAMNEKRKPTF